MRIGQHVKWQSLGNPDKWFTGTVQSFEHDLEGLATVRVDGFPDEEAMPIRRKRLVIPQPPAKFTAKGGGDDHAPSGVLIAEAA